MSLGLEAGGDVGVLPGLAPAITLVASFARGPARFALYGTLWPEKDVQLAISRHPQGGALRLWTVGVSACFSFVVLCACGGAEAGRMWGRGLGVSDPSSGGGRWVAALVGVRRSFSPRPLLGEWQLTLGLEAVAPLGLPWFVVDGEELFQPSPMGVRGRVGIERWFQ